MRERKRKHDDVHWPMPEKQGRRKPTQAMATLVPDPSLTPCYGCSMARSQCRCRSLDEAAGMAVGLDDGRPD